MYNNFIKYKRFQKLRFHPQVRNVGCTIRNQNSSRTSKLYFDCLVLGAKQTLGEDKTESMSPALCELFGHLVIKSK